MAAVLEEAGATVSRLGGADSVLLGVLGVVALVLVEVALVKAAAFSAAATLVAALALAGLYRCGSRFLLGILVVSALVLAQARLFELVKSALTAIAVVDASGSLTGAVWRDSAGARLLQASALFVVVAALAFVVYKWRHALIQTAVRRSDHITPERVLICPTLPGRAAAIWSPTRLRRLTAAPHAAAIDTGAVGGRSEGAGTRPIGMTVRS